MRNRFPVLVFAAAAAATIAVDRVAVGQTCSPNPSCSAPPSAGACNPYGQWPSGIIYCKWTTGTETDYPNSEVRKAMNDWENLTDHVISFQQTTVSDTADSPVRTKINVLTGNGGLRD
jgi:hypothetical protein